jgi:hypothetical protein
VSQYRQGTDVSHDDTLSADTWHRWSADRADWRDQMRADLDPYATVDTRTTEITAIVPPGGYGPRPVEVGLALAAIIGKVRAWETRGTEAERGKRLHNLYQYLSGRVEGCTNPLGGLRQYRQFNDAAADAAEILTLGSAS